MKLKKLYLTVIAICAAALCVGAVFDFGDAERKLCRAAGVYDMLSDELVEMYETEISCESVLSNKSSAYLERTAGRLKIDVSKLRAIILLQDLAARVNQQISLSELASMSDIKLLGFFKQCGDAYLATLPEERQTELKEKLKNLIKIKI